MLEAIQTSNRMKLGRDKRSNDVGMRVRSLDSVERVAV